MSKPRRYEAAIGIKWILRSSSLTLGMPPPLFCQHSTCCGIYCKSVPVSALWAPAHLFKGTAFLLVQDLGRQGQTLARRQSIDHLRQRTPSPTQFDAARDHRRWHSTKRTQTANRWCDRPPQVRRIKISIPLPQQRAWLHARTGLSMCLPNDVHLALKNHRADWMSAPAPRPLPRKRIMMQGDH